MTSVAGVPGTHSIHCVVAVYDKPYSLSNTCSYFDVKSGGECQDLTCTGRVTIAIC